MRIRTLLTLALSASLGACGGGGGGDSGSPMVIEGSLTQGGTPGEQRQLAHGAGQSLEDVQVCAADTCSTTDGNGRWGFLLGSDFNGGLMLFTIRGHGIDATTSVDLPAGAQNVVIELVNEGNNSVRADAVTVDGVEVVSHGEENGDSHSS